MKEIERKAKLVYEMVCEICEFSKKLSEENEESKELIISYAKEAILCTVKFRSTIESYNSQAGENLDVVVSMKEVYNCTTKLVELLKSFETNSTKLEDLFSAFALSLNDVGTFIKYNRMLIEQRKEWQMKTIQETLESKKTKKSKSKESTSLDDILEENIEILSERRSMERTRSEHIQRQKPELEKTKSLNSLLSETNTKKPALIPVSKVANENGNSNGSSSKEEKYERKRIQKEEEIGLKENTKSINPNIKKKKTLLCKSHK